MNIDTSIADDMELVYSPLNVLTSIGSHLGQLTVNGVFPGVHLLASHIMSPDRSLFMQVLMGSIPQRELTFSEQAYICVYLYNIVEMKRYALQALSISYKLHMSYLHTHCIIYTQIYVTPCIFEYFDVFSFR